jgi:hypothetical protein
LFTKKTAGDKRWADYFLIEMRRDAIEGVVSKGKGSEEMDAEGVLRFAEKKCAILSRKNPY